MLREMVYIRIKKIQNKEYAYLVESTTSTRGSRQKVKQYLGKVYRLKLESERSQKLNVKNNQEFVYSLVRDHLQAMGFKEEKRVLTNHLVQFSDEDCSFHKKDSRKEVVLAPESGYLCRYTLQRLLSFKKSKDINNDAYTLAKYFLEAGLQITEEEFVQFYSLL